MRWCVLMAIAAATLVTSCDDGPAVPVTLYRSSPLSPGLRVHWATFDADESAEYNIRNCTMAARLLNANIRALNGEAYDPALGFWCEPGRFSEKGRVPAGFAGQFPFDG